MKNPSAADLHSIALSNMGNMRGDPEVLEDMGIVVSPESLESDLKSAAEGRRLTQKKVLAPELGSVLCGDCCEDVPAGASCGHLTNPVNGKAQIRG